MAENGTKPEKESEAKPVYDKIQEKLKASEKYTEEALVEVFKQENIKTEDEKKQLEFVKFTDGIQALDIELT